MNQTSKIKRNIIIFAVISIICGWIGYLVDQFTGQANYENMGTATGNGSLGMLIWLVSPLICTIFLRTFGGDGWQHAGFSLNFKHNKNILRLVVKKSPTGESTHYFFHSQDDKVEVSC